jgi:hypothetical protein
LQYLIEKLQNKTITETSVEVVSIAGMTSLIKKSGGHHCRNVTYKKSNKIMSTGGQHHRNIIKRRGGQHHRNRWSA